MAAPNPLVSAIVRGARARGLDPAAVLAVAAQEGLSGGIGDGGHAYGPFQLNNAGGVLTGIRNGVNDQATQAWASSPAGIAFALDRIAGVARGLRGRQAVNAIVSRFERPANPGREIAGALSAYGRYGGVGGESGAAPPPQSPFAPPSSPIQARGLSPDVLGLFNQGNEMFGLPALPVGIGSAPLRLPSAGPQPTSPVAAPPLSPVKAPVQVKGPTLKWIEKFAAPFGLTVTSTTGGTHAPHSYHYQGRAVDFGGSPQGMASLAKYALAHPGQFKEMFYTGPGHPNFFISGGQVLPLSQLDHSLYTEHENHVHLAR